MSSANNKPDYTADNGFAVGEDIERLIVRKLDGELGDEESLALDRELLRCPQARAMFDAYSRNDALVGAAIRDVANCGETSIAAAIESNSSQRGGQRESGQREMDSIRFDQRRTARTHRWMWAASAIAACLALVMFWHTPADRTGGGNNFTERDAAPGPVRKNHAPIHKVGIPGGDVGVFNAADIAPRPVNRQTDRNYYFVPNKSDGRIYLLSVDRIREMEQPKTTGDDARRWDPV